MDHMIYTALSGAKQTLERQSIVANNMANASTPGFRAELSAYRAVPVNGAGHQTRAIVAESTPGSDFQTGTIQTTGRALDVAIDGQGWLAVQSPDGSEGYTRGGGLQVDSTGLLRSNGQAVLGEDGPIVMPLGAEDVSIASDGTISAVAAGGQPNARAEIGRLKLVNPAEGSLMRGEDGLFHIRTPNGQPAPAQPLDDTVRLVSGAIESSNVNPTEAMVAMIDNARRFEMQMKMLQSADENDQKANSLLSLS
ncbi:flagellar basal-body rod protein FlgF [Kushneria phosphatilytica]|uniref:Flagellar basal-body rod protein FlgF n=1 Tax=Kushneria phosphatilytica TaxID=657387 RepID=A0A1S1NVN2_9GAMM|nr:flagellar basal-body rod protein FlgF [Kushneria phosphatilytica]OHV12021.1 flagellar basal-body rod protein FlgF [Kushneria phosphatilytica]QEL11214.1 flagellar basal-body rod protein FlgF [Kushneria phosphatilytica]